MVEEGWEAMSAPRTKPPTDAYDAGWDAVFGKRRPKKGVAVRSVNRRLVEKDGRTVRSVVRERPDRPSRDDEPVPKGGLM